MIEQQLVEQWVRAATDEVFATMLGLQLEAGKAGVEPVAAGPTDGVVSLIGFAGALVGTGCVWCGAPLACRLAGALLMAEPAPEAVNEEVLDAIAELTNMIIGNVKTALEERAGPMGLSIPTVVFGRNFTTRMAGKEDWIVMPFRCGGEPLEIRVFLTKPREAVPVRHGYATALNLSA